MKRTIPGQVIFMLFLVLSASLDGLAADRGMVSAAGSYFVPGDKNFKDFYGNGHFYPELKAGVTVSGKFYLWAAYGFLSSKGETPVLNLETKVSQHFFSGGIGYRFPLSGRVELLVEPGLLYVKYKEELLLLREELSAGAVGFRLGSALLYHMSRRVFVELSLGFFTASDTLDDVSVKLGGFKTGIGLGVTF